MTWLVDGLFAGRLTHYVVVYIIVASNLWFMVAIRPIKTAQKMRLSETRRVQACLFAIDITIILCI
jgi:hypothetical protein